MSYSWLKIKQQKAFSMANLIVCCDGTWNSPDNQDDGVPAPTNVRQIYHCLKSIPGEQETRYQSGVGTGGVIDRVIGGVLGFGLSEDIRDCYQWLCDKYQPGDKIHLIGFSRGAYTARSLGGMIAKLGLVDFSTVEDGERDSLVKTVYGKGYRSELSYQAFIAEYDIRFRPNSNGIHFVGVFDTVGALGIPNDKAIMDLFDNHKKYNFHDTKISSNISHARHAVAIDERRGSFTPTLWKEDDLPIGSDVVQKWFPGVHSDIGGGYKEKGLSNGTLKWMIEEMRSVSNDLQWVDSQLEQIKVNVKDELHDSHVGVMKVLVTAPRSIPNIVTQSNRYHESALERRNDPPIEQGAYLTLRKLDVDTPAAIDIYARHPYSWTGIYLEKGKHYRFTASGSWVDSTIACKAGGTTDGKFQPQEIFHVAGSLFGKMETFFKGVFNKEDANFFGTKRHENAPWFCLMGAIANGGKPHADGTHIPLESFKIGDERSSFSPLNSGYLYCYPNDAWGFYGNNRGYVTLKVEQLP